MNGSRTFMARQETVEPKWYVVDASGKTLGRLASQVARILMGKHRPTYTPHVDTGDYVVIINAEKIYVSGNKMQGRVVYRHSGHPGGFRGTTYAEIMEKHPERLIERVVKGMIPRNRLSFGRKLKVYAGPNHPHAAQNPEPLDL
jgi:large subunit ribosomal protein L13